MTPIHTYSHTSGETRTAGPRKSTLDFLRQLARAYSPEPRVAVAELRGAIMN